MILCFSFLIAFFHRFSIGVLSNLLASDLDLSATQLGTLSSLYFYAYGFLQIPVGIITDKYGVRRITFAGMLFIASGAFIFALAAGPALAYTGRLLIGVGSATFFVSILRVIANWFPPESFTRLLGWTSLIGTSGALLAATPLSLLLNLLDWRLSLNLFAVISLIIAGLIWFFVRDNPAEVGLEVDYGAENDSRSLREILQGMSVLVTSRQFWGYFFVAFIVFGSQMSLSGLWLVPYLTHVFRISRDLAANFVMVITFGMVAGSALLGWFEKKLGSRIRMIRIAVLINLLIWFYILVIFRAVLPLWQLLVLLFILGFSGTFIVTTFTNIKVLFPDFKGSATGFINLSPFLGTIIFNFLIGWRLDATWEGEMLGGSRAYTLQGYQQGFAMILLLAGLALLISLKLKNVKVNQNDSAAVD